MIFHFLSKATKWYPVREYAIEYEIARRNNCLCFYMGNSIRPSLHYTVGTCRSRNATDKVTQT